MTLSDATLVFHLPVMPDETLYSWLGRCVIQTGYPSARLAIKALVGSEHKQFSSTLSNVVPALSALTGINGFVLVENHSILPIFRSFVSAGVYQLAQTGMVSGKTGELDKLLSTTANRMKLNVPLRYCPHCCALDEAKHGFPFWHVEHQLPGVYVCLKHQLLLQDRAVVRRDFIFPANHCETNAELTTEALLLTQFVSDAWHQPLAGYDHERYQHCVVEKLRLSGFITEQGRVRQSKWQQSFLEFWQPLLHITEISALLQNEAGLYLQSFCYAEPKTLSPLKHFLLLAHLFDSWKSFTAFYAQLNTISVKAESLPGKAPKAKVPKYRPDQHGSLRSFAKRINCSIITAKKLAVQQGVQIERRPQTIFGAERDLITQLLSDGLSTAKIANKISCSVAAVEQILAQNPDIVKQRKEMRLSVTRQKHRDAIQQLLALKSTWRRTDVQKAARAAYTWLYKHDSEWLYQQLPAETPREQRWLH